MTHVPLKDLPEFVRNVRAMLKLLPHKNSATLVYLQGELGSGKTTFMQQLGRELGIEVPMQSPTYVLMKTYRIEGERLPNGAPRRFKRLVHIDAYRLNSAAEFAALRPEQFLEDPEALVCIEWPERVAEALPEPDLTIAFSSEGVGEAERNIEMQK
ncbi:MAG: tRNA (adenosine(37)-N6)-threonylcarbamoyltransferase complex ATPase subunit type 1 TsaE [Patescibacteria group bacterium]|nr:tRNA (adenosine(37)-N6)-threonylcarbamoyltransferase complex ATPase subunit type 1 TsaE [Patescibacteria group bacterium]